MMVVTWVWDHKSELCSLRTCGVAASTGVMAASAVVTERVVLYIFHQQIELNLYSS
jgi:hypothetical protein